MTYQTNKKEKSIELKRDRFGQPLIEWCCEKLKLAFDKGFIGFGEEGWFNTINGFCIYYRRCYPEGACTYEIKISYCPFCGEKIEEVEKFVL
jgi:hypothetical protein